MSSVTPSTVATATATPTSTTCAGPKLYELPVDDAACGVPNIENYEELFSDCAQPAAVLPYNDDCGLYALAVDQSIQDLTDCLYEAGVAWEDAWCSGETNATATATDYPSATTTLASSGTSTESGQATSTETSAAVPSLNKESLGVKSLALAALVFSGLFARV